MEVPGHVSLIRINTDMTSPIKTEKSASRRYWMPMTLWSMLKMYFRMKPVGGPWWWMGPPCASSCSSWVSSWPNVSTSAISQLLFAHVSWARTGF